MKTILALVVVAVLSACSTTAGMVKGLGEDVKAGADWTASKIKPN